MANKAQLGAIHNWIWNHSKHFMAPKSCNLNNQKISLSNKRVKALAWALPQALIILTEGAWLAKGVAPAKSPNGATLI